jgi:iron only hydrogenase large subunit-like protein
MKGYFNLTFNAENSIIIFGKRLSKYEIIFKGKPSFFEATRFSDSSSPIGEDFHFQHIPISATPNKTFHFHDPVLDKKIKITINHHKLIIQDIDNILTPEEVNNIFDYFLIKRGKKMLFLTNVPNNKILKREKDKQLTNNVTEDRKKEN